MKKYLWALLVSTLGNMAMAQVIQVPTDSVNGNSTQAVVAITAPSISQITNSVLQTLSDSDKDGLGKAFEQSWTALLGNTSQRFVPHKMTTTGGWGVEFTPSGVLYKVMLTSYNCNAQVYVNGRWYPTCEATGSYQSVTNMGHATGSRQLMVSVPQYTSAGCSEGCGSYTVYSYFRMNPIISSGGDLTGYSFQNADDDFWYASYNNPSLALATTGSYPLYFCDPQNACGYNRWGWTFTVSN